MVISRKNCLGETVPLPPCSFTILFLFSSLHFPFKNPYFQHPTHMPKLPSSWHKKNSISIEFFALFSKHLFWTWHVWRLGSESSYWLGFQPRWCDVTIGNLVQTWTFVFGASSGLIPINQLSCFPCMFFFVRFFVVFSWFMTSCWLLCSLGCWMDMLRGWGAWGEWSTSPQKQQKPIKQWENKKISNSFLLSWPCFDVFLGSWILVSCFAFWLVEVMSVLGGGELGGGGQSTSPQ